MNARLSAALEDAAALPEADQDRLADLIAGYILNRTATVELSEEQWAELKRRHEEPFDPAPEEEVREFFAPYRG